MGKLIYSIMCFIFKYPVDARYCPVIQPFEQLTFKEKAAPLLLARADYFFERKKILLETRISDQVDSPKPTLAKQFLHNITILHNASGRKRCLYLLHLLPQQTRCIPVTRHRILTRELENIDSA